MADNRKPYTVTIGGVEHTMLLDDDSAKRYGELARPVREKAVEKPANKARSAPNKK